MRKEFWSHERPALMHGLMIGLSLAGLFSAVAADPTVSVTAQQRYPWNGMVDVAFTITGESGTKYETSLKALDVENNEALPMKTVYKSDGSAASATEKLLPGNYCWVWNAQADVEADWLRSTGCLSTSSKIVFINQNLSEVTEFSAILCGKFVDDKTQRVKGTWVKTDGAGKEVQFALADGAYTKCVCVHYEQSGVEIIGYIKWAKYVTGDSTGKDFNAISATSQTIATSETEEGYGLRNVAIKTSSYKKAYSCDRVTVDVSAKACEGLYMVIDLSGGSSATSYPVNYLDAVPSGGWTDTYKTTKLVLRKVTAGTNSAGGSMSKDMWVGIFEITQKQWSLVGMSFPEYCDFRSDMYPIAGLRCGTSGGDDTAQTGGCHLFLNAIKTKVSALSLARLPTRNEWEYACRAGTTTDLNNGKGLSIANLNKVARWGLYVEGATGYSKCSYAAVGSYAANSWQLYDMHGNQGEVTSEHSNNGYWVCGGCYSSYMDECTSSSKDDGAGLCGMRLFAEVK